jgi:hypothetical protein
MYDTADINMALFFLPFKKNRSRIKGISCFLFPILCGFKQNTNFIQNCTGKIKNLQFIFYFILFLQIKKLLTQCENLPKKQPQKKKRNFTRDVT